MVEPRAVVGGWQGHLARAGLYGAILSLIAGAAAAAPLQIVVDGVESSKGNVMVAVCSEAEFLQPHCSYNGQAKAHPGPVLVTIEVPPGVYAAQAYQDEDGNGVLTQNLIGLPIEPLGFSNNVTIRMSAPRFRDAAFQVGPMGGRIEIRVKRLF